MATQQHNGHMDERNCAMDTAEDAKDGGAQNVLTTGRISEFGQQDLGNVAIVRNDMEQHGMTRLPCAPVTDTACASAKRLEPEKCLIRTFVLQAQMFEPVQTRYVTLARFPESIEVTFSQ